MIYIKPVNSPIIEIGEGDANIGLSENHEFGSDVVSQPLENGASLFDHVITLPDEVEVVIHTGNAPRPNSDQRYPSQILYAQLKELRNKRERCSLFTLHEIYDNLVIKSVSVPNVAPFAGRTDITVKFVRVDFISEIQNQFQRDWFEAPRIEANRQMTPYSKLSKELKDIIQKENTLKIFAGRPIPIENVVESASSFEDIGSDQVLDEIPEFGGDYLDELSDEEWLDEYFSFIDSLEAPQNWLKSAYFALANLLKKIGNFFANAMSVGADYTAAIRDKIQTFCAAVSFVSNLSIGAQRFVRSIMGQLIGIKNYFSVLTGNWSFSFTDATGIDILAGAGFVAGVNILAGLGLSYTALDVNGEAVSSPLAAKGLYVLTEDPFLTPWSFAPGTDGVAPAVLMVLTSAAAVKALDELLLMMQQKEEKFSFDEMDYSFI